MNFAEMYGWKLRNCEKMENNKKWRKKMRKAKIIRYYEVIDDFGYVISRTHILKDAKKSKEEYEEKENDE